MADILWSDPTKLNGRHPSKRGISIMFGPDVAHKFLNENNLGIRLMFKLQTCLFGHTK
jgi:serine/threonine-protein phosphatase 5